MEHSDIEEANRIYREQHGRTGNTLAVEITKKDQDQWVEEAAILLGTAECFEVVDTASLERAAEFVKRIDREIRAVKDTFAPMRERAHQAHKTVCDQEKKHLGQREQSRRIVKGKIGAWQTEQERIRRDEQARLQREAQKQADDVALRRAEALEADGRKGEAQAAIDNPVQAPIMPAPPAPPKLEGTQTRVYWRHRVTDADAVPRQWMVVDDKALAVYARSAKAAAKVAGVEFYSERY